MLGEERPYEELDLDALEEEFNQSWVDPEEETETETENIENPEEPEEELEPEEAENPEDLESPEEPGELEEEPEEEAELSRDEPFTKKSKQTKEENAAFAELRRQKEAAEAQARVLEQVAAQYNMTPEQFQAAWKQQQDEARAKQQGIPVDVLRRMESMESQLNEQKGSAAKDKFWNEVDTVKAKYDLTNDDINKIFNYIGEQGLVNLETKLPSVGFEFAYKAANFDNVLARRETEAKQKDLAAKKKRQTNAPKGHTNSNAGKQTSQDDLSVDDVEKMLRSEGLI